MLGNNDVRCLTSDLIAQLTNSHASGMCLVPRFTIQINRSVYRPPLKELYMYICATLLLEAPVVGKYFELIHTYR